VQLQRADFQISHWCEMFCGYMEIYVYQGLRGLRTLSPVAADTCEHGGSCWEQALSQVIPKKRAAPARQIATPEQRSLFSESVRLRSARQTWDEQWGDVFEDEP
jgi:hypothetical protein